MWRHPDSLRRFVDEVEDAGVRPDLLVLDTLVNCLRGASDSDNGHMRELLGSAEEPVRRWGSAVLLVHHTPKIGDSPRGTQALQDGAAMRCLPNR